MIKDSAAFSRLIHLGAIVLACKVILLVLMVLAMCFGGISNLQRLWLGVEVVPVNDTIRAQFGMDKKGGVLVNRVLEHSPAAEGRLRRGDIILSIDNSPIYEPADIHTALEGMRFRDSVRLIYFRDGDVFSTKLALDYRAKNTTAANVRSLHKYQLTVSDFLGLAALGLLAGTLSGMIGCGGGVLKVSLLILLFGFEIFLAKVVSLISCGFMSMSSSYRYVKHDLVDIQSLKYLIPSSIVGGIVGVGISMMLDRHVLEVALGLFLVYAAVDMGYQIYSDARGKRSHGAENESACDGSSASYDRPGLVLAGLAIGIFCTVLGITGGVVGIPLQRFFAKVPIRTCIANTLVTVIFVSFLGGGVLLIEGVIRGYFAFPTFLQVLVAIMPGSVVGGQLGAMLNKKLPVNYIKGIYAIVVVFIAYKILFTV